MPDPVIVWLRSDSAVERARCEAWDSVSREQFVAELQARDDLRLIVSPKGPDA